MFLDFFYLLREKGLDVTPTDWLTLTEALDKGLADNSFTGFYQLCRAVLVKSENQYDKFDRAFLEHFKGIAEMPEIPEDFYKWLANPRGSEQMDGINKNQSARRSAEQIEQMLRERIAEQTCQHDGGTYWVGTGGASNFGNSSAAEEAGIRVGGQGHYHAAMRVAGERRFRDFSEDEVLNLRQYQMAFRRLRQFSGETNAAKTELDLDATIQATSDNAGKLKIEYRRPRQNTVKLLLLIDSGGSMDEHIAMVTAMFQAVKKSNHFQDLKIYYFHNCIHDRLYTDPTCTPGRWEESEHVLHQLDGNYKMIILGDAEMAPYELLNYRFVNGTRMCGLDWFEVFKKHYTHNIWLNPSDGTSYRGSLDYWDYGSSLHKAGQVADTYTILKNTFDMYTLTLKNLEIALKKLLVNQ